jgi:hypothetical protein
LVALLSSKELHEMHGALYFRLERVLYTLNRKHDRSPACLLQQMARDLREGTTQLPEPSQERKISTHVTISPHWLEERSDRTML